MTYDTAAYKRAQQRVEELKGFYIHIAVYAIVILGLLGINLLTWGGYLWVAWPALGWGVGVAIHAATVLGIGRFFGPEWEERKTRELMEREQEPRDRHHPAGV